VNTCTVLVHTKMLRSTPDAFSFLIFLIKPGTAQKYSCTSTRKCFPAPTLAILVYDPTPLCNVNQSFFRIQVKITMLNISYDSAYPKWPTANPFNIAPCRLVLGIAVGVVAACRMGGTDSRLKFDEDPLGFIPCTADSVRMSGGRVAVVPGKSVKDSSGPGQQKSLYRFSWYVLAPTTTNHHHKRS
jgi:hypothetical protein